MNDIRNAVYEFFAACLDYPSPALAERIRRDMPGLRECMQSAGLPVEPINGFREFVERNPMESVEELYTATFDLQPSCYPYVGYQLFGEDYSRGLLMAKLKECYRACGYSIGHELPDHIGVMLRFLARDEDAALGRELVDECIVPALRKMEQPLQESGNPYGKVVQALVLFLTA